ncbi:potassium voltage-gated channel subfamily H member 6-like [Stylophora pistillata]|nr:potassium voltage-gated channel subfamily H member 6-like [Stylophora pistillata]XP_022788294.1 potassium voltage-gated channel subfamily H member 6-like [Stylophora pistillata]
MSSVALDIIAETKRRSLNRDTKPDSPIRDKIEKCTIHHESVFKAIWDWFVLALVLYTSIEIPYKAAFLTKDVQRKGVWEKINAGEPREVVNLLVDLMFIIDILINFRTTYVDKTSDMVISTPKKIAVHYLKSWFTIDFVSAIPFDYFIPDEFEEAATVAGLLKTARLLRLVRVSRKMDRYSEYGLALVFLLTSFFTLVAHWLACIWLAIGNREDKVPYGWIQLLAERMRKPINDSVPGSGPGNGTRYITALYFALTSLTSIGFGNVAPHTDNEKIFSVITMLIGALFYATIFGNLTAIIQRLYSRSARYHRDTRVIKEFITLYNIPEPLQGTLREYFTMEQTAAKGDDIESIMHRFPESLQADIRVHLNRQVLDHFEIFRGASEGSRRALATAFRVEMFPQHHFLLKEGDQVTKLYFIVSGSVEVIRSQQSMKFLGPGEIVGCNMMSSQRRPGHSFKSKASLASRVSSQVHLIAWPDLLRITRVYPEIRECIMEQMELLYDLDSGEMDDQDSARAGDQKRDYFDLLQMGAGENSAQVLAMGGRRSRSNTVGEFSTTNDRISNRYQIDRGLFTTDVDVPQLEARLAHMEDLITKIAKSLNIEEGVTRKRKSQSANDLFSSTSYV